MTPSLDVAVCVCRGLHGPGPEPGNTDNVGVIWPFFFGKLKFHVAALTLWS
jgi:hypothetical protein